VVNNNKRTAKNNAFNGRCNDSWYIYITTLQFLTVIVSVTLMSLIWYSGGPGALVPLAHT